MSAVTLIELSDNFLRELQKGSSGSLECPAAMDDDAAAAAERARQVELLRSRRLEHPGEDDERSTCTRAIERDIRGSPQ